MFKGAIHREITIFFNGNQCNGYRSCFEELSELLLHGTSRFFGLHALGDIAQHAGNPHHRAVLPDRFTKLLDGHHPPIRHDETEPGEKAFSRGDGGLEIARHDFGIVRMDEIGDRPADDLLR